MDTRQSLAIVAALLMTIPIGGPARAGAHFEPPVRLEADGNVIDTGAAWGHCSPCVVDLDGDKLDDLLLGDFSGKFRIYRNVGKPNAPKYQAGELLQAGGVTAEVNIYCCIGSQPRFHDLDGDGIRDMLSNSYDPGHAYLFRGLPGNQLAAREELLDKNRIPVRSSPVQQQNHQSFGSFSKRSTGMRTAIATFSSAASAASCGCASTKAARSSRASLRRTSTSS